MVLYLDTSGKVAKAWLDLGVESHKFQDKLESIDAAETIDTKHAEFDLDRNMSKDLLGCLDGFLKQNGADWHKLTGLALMKGPGSFTGLRIGASIFNAVANSEKIPIVGEIGGENWRRTAKNRLFGGEDDQIVLPFYNSEANITIPKK